MSVSVGPPRRGRRSSISEHIQRVFHVDRPDKKCQSIRSDGGSPGQASVVTQPNTASHNTKSDAAINYATPARSSFTYSSQASGQPASGTPHSSPQSRRIIPDDEKDSSQQMPSMETNGTDAERDKICSSPTWHKDIARKERRATKRLEADRRDLEERLLRLEANQARLEQGNYERAPRRLTKKQPLGSSNRSSSTNSERPRSSSAFSSFFSSSRRSSRSRASSVDDNDGASRRCSTDIPPTLSLTLPERFGTAISRELAAKHGSLLLSSHQPQRTIHTTPRSDDLRENWRVAEAWQKKNGGDESDAERSGRKSELAAFSQVVAHNMTREDEPRSRLQTRDPSAELDRELFTANLRHDRRSLGPKPTINSSVSQDTRQLQDLSQPPNMANSVNRGRSRSFLPGPGKVTLSQQNNMDLFSPGHPKNYKSSPLALQPSTVESSGPANEARISTRTQGADSKNIPLTKPPHLSQPYQRQEIRSHNRLSAPSEPPVVAPGQLKELVGNEQRDSIQGPLHSTEHNHGPPENWRPRHSTNNQEQTSVQMRRSTQEPPRLKHAARSVSQPINRPIQIGNEGQQLPNTKMDTPVDSYQEPMDSPEPPSEEAARGRPKLRCLNPPTHSRSPSQVSSHASYDTADEEVLNVPRREKELTASTEACSMTSPRPAQDILAVEKQRTDQAGTQTNSLPQPALDGSLTKLRRKVKQKAKPLMPDQLVAKVFVICCRCKYWHDMPSEVYARLACPERLPSDSLLARTFSRRGSFSRKGSLRSSLLALDPSGKGRLPMPGRAQPDEENIQAIRESKAAAGTPLTPPSCCWCKHSMSRSCCQGWTTLVQMRERHH